MTDLTNKQLTDMYNLANNIGEGKNPPISTEKIFAAMRLAHAIGRAEVEFPEPEKSLTPTQKCVE